MKILLVHPGASMSTADVHTGLYNGLKAHGAEVWEYALDARIEMSGAWLTYCWRKGGKTVTQPTSGDIIYHAGAELLTRALRVMPDVVLVVSGMFLHPDVLVLFRRTDLKGKVAVLFTESPYDDERQALLAPWVDWSWTNERLSVRPGVAYLPHAYDPAIHAPSAENEARAHDVVFVGTGFQERVELLEVIDWTGIDFGLYGSWDLLGPRHKLRKHLVRSDESDPDTGYVDNASAAKLYQRAKIGLNLYRQSQGFGKGAPRIARAESLNPRAYELAAMRCFTLSEARAEVAEIFGHLVPTFADAAQLQAQLAYWLHPQQETWRTKIQRQLPEAVAGHTWHARAAQVLDDLVARGIGSRSDGLRRTDIEPAAVASATCAAAPGVS